MQDKKPQAAPSRADRFWNIFLFTKNGRVKSQQIIYTFSLSFVLMLIYGAATWFFLDPLQSLAEVWPPFIFTVAESLIPALAGCAIVCLVHKFTGSKRFIPAAHLWLLLYALIILFFMMISLNDAQDRGIFLSLSLRVMFLPVLLGGLSTWMMYRKTGTPKKTIKPSSAGLPEN